MIDEFADKRRTEAVYDKTIERLQMDIRIHSNAKGELFRGIQISDITFNVTDLEKEPFEGHQCRYYRIAESVVLALADQCSSSYPRPGDLRRPTYDELTQLYMSMHQETAGISDALRSLRHLLQPRSLPPAVCSIQIEATQSILLFYLTKLDSPLPRS